MLRGEKYSWVKNCLKILFNFKYVILMCLGLGKWIFMLAPKKVRPLCVPVAGRTTGSSQNLTFILFSWPCLCPIYMLKTLFFIILTSDNREELLQEKKSFKWYGKDFRHHNGLYCQKFLFHVFFIIKKVNYLLSSLKSDGAHFSIAVFG